MASDPPLAHQTASAPKKPPPNPTGTIVITAGASESTSRTWTMSQALLAKHSSYYRHLFATSHSFSNFVDYLYSSIYSTNTQVANYSVLRAHTDACILGAKLGAKGYTGSAIRALHALFEPPDQSQNLGPTEGQRTITEADLEYVCIHAEEEFLPPDVEDVGALTGLRYLFFDALAVHWGRRRVLDMRDCRIDAGAGAGAMSESKATWVSLWFAFPKLAERVGDTWNIMGRYRSEFLKEAEEYLCVYEGDTDVKE